MPPASADEPAAIDPLLGDKPRPVAAASASARPAWRLPGHWWWVLALVIAVVGLLAGLDHVLGHRGEVAANVELAGQDVAGLDRTALDDAVTGLAERLAATPVTVRSDAGVITASAADLGLAVDGPGTAGAAWAANRPGVPLVGWAVMRVRGADVPAVLTTSGWHGEQVLGTGPVAAEAQLEVHDGALVAVGGTPTLGIDPVAVRQQLEGVAWTGGPIDVTVPAATALPARSAADVQAVADRVNAATAAPLTVAAGGASTVVDPAVVRGWVRLAPTAAGFTLDPDAVSEDLSARFADRATQAEDAHFVVDAGQPVVAGGTPGVSCCGPDAVSPLVEALAAGTPPAAPVTVPLQVDQPDVTAADLDALGVREPVGSFETKFRCCEARVTNIRRMAELLQGQLIRPGDTLSINDLVGPRTPEKGFVPAPAIVEGKIAKDEIGGGVSQVMTTLFNAAFFAGLDYGEYQSHSLYFDRYPYGREATVNWPGPDLQIRNTTTHGVVVVTTVSNTAIRITLWSTKVYADVEQTGQTEGVSGVSCTLVTTERTRTRLDGTTDVDTVRAIYRREEGLDCDQAELPPSTAPSTTPTTAAATTAAPTTTATTAAASP